MANPNDKPDSPINPSDTGAKDAKETQSIGDVNQTTSSIGDTKAKTPSNEGEEAKTSSSGGEKAKTVSNGGAEATPGHAEVQRPRSITNPQPHKQWSTNYGSYFQSLRFDVMKTYLEQVESRDKICRAIQYGSKFISGGEEAGVAHELDVSTGLARKVFRLLKSINELEALSKSPHTSLPVMLVDKSNHALMAIYFALDNLVWAGRVGIYKNKQHTDLLANLSLYFFLGGSACNSLIELHNLVSHGKEYNKSVERKKKVHESALSLLKSSMDVVVAIGLLHMAKKRVTPRITGACGFVSSLITCYELFQLASHEQGAKSHIS